MKFLGVKSTLRRFSRSQAIGLWMLYESFSSRFSFLKHILKTF